MQTASLGMERNVLPHNDPTVEQAARNIERPTGHTDWRLYGPNLVDPGAVETDNTVNSTPRLSDRAVSLFLSDEVALAIFDLLQARTVISPTRTGKGYRVRLKKKALGATNSKGIASENQPAMKGNE